MDKIHREQEVTSLDMFPSNLSPMDMEIDAIIADIVRVKIAESEKETFLDKIKRFFGLNKKNKSEVL